MIIEYSTLIFDNQKKRFFQNNRFLEKPKLTPPNTYIYIAPVRQSLFVCLNAVLRVVVRTAVQVWWVTSLVNKHWSVYRTVHFLLT